ncbi:hypothetical protein BTO06_09985 [Tenacibaculum sp. SZ-18]|uniref:hypothetical protein n=1 Tax=Tenacibaculum sp. SZ-18 TaxID=754423 RepID=UPI000C2D45E2|nr:hypothetical protein [Tenacibaculum sp. SZ-18]AUC15450.1 hypothetical protein BTO06_09985 [Tenacibaculum sp. SZ-18]
MNLESTNYQGILNNGNKFKLRSKTSYNEIFNQFCLMVSVEEFIYDGWFTDSDKTISIWYTRPEERLESFNTCIKELENRIGFKLSKNNLKAA